MIDALEVCLLQLSEEAMMAAMALLNLLMALTQHWLHMCVLQSWPNNCEVHHMYMYCPCMPALSIQLPAGPHRLLDFLSTAIH